MPTISPIASSGFGDPPVLVEPGDVARLQRVRVDDGDARSERTTECRGRRRRIGRDEAGALARAVALDELTPEPAEEPVAIGRGRLGAERLDERVVGVVGLFGLCEDVGDRLADVREERGAEPPHVVEEP